MAAGEDGSTTMGNSEVLNTVPDSNRPRQKWFWDPNGNGMEQLQESNEKYNTLKKLFLDKMGPLASQTSVVAIHSISYSGWSGKFRCQSHQILSRAVNNKFGCEAKYNWGWYGASKDDISAIVSHGFTRPDAPVYGRSHGVGIHLSHPNRLPHEMIYSDPDEEGISHIFSCRVIIGKAEVIEDGSKQFKPSSVEFDTGVDNLVAPKVFIVWNAHMNSYLKPEMVISFKFPTWGNNSMSNMKQRISYPNLLTILQRLLEPTRFHLISEQYDLVEQNEMPISVMIHVMRDIAGDELMDTLAKYNRN